MNLNKIVIWIFALLVIVMAWLVVVKGPTDSRAASFDPRNGVFTVMAPMGQEGSAFIIDDNFFVTNAHIMEWQSPQNTFKLNAYRDTSRYTVELLFIDREADIAFFKIKEWDKFKTDEKWNKLELETAVVDVGDYVYTLGSPMGIQGAMTDGIISATYQPIMGPEVSIGHYMTAVVNPGNSGGPLLDSQDRVVGINTMKINDAREYNYAISSDFVALVLKEYKSKGIYDFKPLGGQIGTRPDGQVAILKVGPNGIFSEMGLQAGDILLKWSTEWTIKTGNENVFSGWYFNTQHTMGSDGEKVFAEIERNGQKMTLSGTL